jgi:hypothetical protein
VAALRARRDRVDVALLRSPTLLLVVSWWGLMSDRALRVSRPCRVGLAEVVHVVCVVDGVVPGFMSGRAVRVSQVSQSFWLAS